MSVPVDGFASESHYAAHVRPVFEALTDRGSFWDKHPHGDGPVIVAGYRDLLAVANRPVVFMEHGAGQTYGKGHSSFAGGRNHESVVLFLCPAERVVAKWREAYPHTRAVAVGCPKLDPWHSGKFKPHGSAVAISFHWESQTCPETRSAFPFYEAVLPALPKAFGEVLGHAHPRMFDRVAPVYERAGIEPVRNFDEVLDRAGVYICDNSSTIYEFASTDRPVVVLNAPWYRRTANHGLRFWEMSDVGLRCETPSELLATVALAQIDPVQIKNRRHEIVAQVYEACDGHAAERAAAAIAEVTAPANA